MSDHLWLPALLPWDGNADREPKPAYQRAVYAVYERDFINSQPTFRGIRVDRTPEPIRDGMCNTFWHVTTQEIGTERVICPKRYEHIQWVRSMIEATDYADRVRVYPVEHEHGVIRYEIALTDFSYVVVLEQRSDRFILWTTFPQEKNNRRRKAQKKYETWLLTQKS